MLQHVIKSFYLLEGSKALFQMREVVGVPSKVLMSSTMEIFEINSSPGYSKTLEPTRNKGWKKQQKE